MRLVARSLVTVVCLVSVGLGWLADVGRAQSESVPRLELFFLAASDDDDEAAEALDEIAASWKDGYVGILRDLTRFMRAPTDPRPSLFDSGLAEFGSRSPTDTAAAPPRPPDNDFLRAGGGEDPSTKVWRRLAKFIDDRTGIRMRRAQDLPDLHEWMWAQPYDPHPDYARFKGLLYGQVDQRFQDFLDQGTKATIRLDEVDWGGVQVNGIPPLVHPRYVAADDDLASYLDEDDVVFGVAVNGEMRAYPKRILAWHEMALDTLGDVELTVVYCTLCGTVIPYESVVDGERITFGTSGLLYRSNKLMFDIETNSLWNTFEGIPVVGPRVGSGIRLSYRSVVTTTWGEWRQKHPETTVLSLQTGHERDYSEGAAYRDYFSHDRLMFGVPRVDDRLKNKDEVVVFSVTDRTGVRQPVALSVDFLEDHGVHHFEHAGLQLVAITSEEGANRVYDAGGLEFERQLDDDRIVDADGGLWGIHEDGLVSEADPTRRLDRRPAHRAFWFAWHAQFPDTRLVC